MFGLHAQELLIIAFIVVILFGYKRIPELFGGLGKGIRDFKKGLKGDEEQDAKNSDQIQDQKKDS